MEHLFPVLKGQQNHSYQSFMAVRNLALAFQGALYMPQA